MTIDQTMKDEFFFFMNFVPKTIFGGMRKFQPERSKESDPFDGSEAIAWSVNRHDPCLALKWTGEPKHSVLILFAPICVFESIKRPGGAYLPPYVSVWFGLWLQIFL